MLETIESKVAIVTGGTRGIGRAIARRLLAEGARVAICGARQKSVDDAVEFLTPKERIFGVAADVSKLEDVRQFIDAVKQHFGEIHILINNAGVGIFRSVAELTPEEWQRMIGLNLTGAYYCSHEIMPIFIQNGGGDVVNISSLAGKNAFAGGAGYNASKFGLNGLSEAMMHDHRNAGVRVTTIMPGSVDTEFGGAPAPGGDHNAGDNDAEGHNAENDRNAWKIAPDDIAEIVVNVLRLPRRTTVGQIEVRPSRPPGRM
jgi:NAD(P)-dependent dehydrogenase (short-subunit alcohol dehydrogenase family)